MSHTPTSRPRTVAVIGDARVEPDSPKYTLARECGSLLVERGFRVVTGGLGGVMEAASRGARESPVWTPGSIVALLPGSDPDAANAWADVVLPTGLDNVRNAVIAQSDAVVAIGGGAGTLSEMAFAWIHYRLIVALRVDGWSGRLADERAATLPGNERRPGIRSRNCGGGSRNRHDQGREVPKATPVDSVIGRDASSTVSENPVARAPA